jgi:hypothetical protein
MITLWSIKWKGQVALMVETRSVYSVLVGNPERKSPLGRPYPGWQNRWMLRNSDDRVLLWPRIYGTLYASIQFWVVLTGSCFIVLCSVLPSRATYWDINTASAERRDRLYCEPREDTLLVNVERICIRSFARQNKGLQFDHFHFKPPQN